MASATIASKGRVTLPASVRFALAVKTGDRVEFVLMEPGRFEIVAATQSVTALKGMIQRPVTAVTIEAMSEAIARRRAKAQPPV